MRNCFLWFFVFLLPKLIIAQNIEILPKVYPGDSCICSADSAYVLCSKQNKAALFGKEDSSLLKWFNFDEKIRTSQFYRSDKLLIQTDSTGVVLDLKDWELHRSKNFSGTAASFANKGRELYIARPSRSFRQKTTRQILEEMSEPGSYLIHLDKSFEVEDSIALKTIRPEKLSLIGDIAEIYAANPNAGITLHSTGKYIQTEVKVEVIDLKSGEKKIKQKPIQKDPEYFRSEIPAYYYRTSLNEVHFQPESGYLIQYGKGLPEGGVVKAWDLKNARYLGTLGVGNTMNRLEGFFDDHTFIAYDWVDTDSLQTFEEFVYDDSIMRINQKLSIKARLAIDLENLSFSMVKKMDKDSVKAMPRQGIFLDADRSMTPRLRRGNWHIKFDPLSMNFDLMDREGKVLLHFYSFENEEWAIVHPEGKWIGSTDCPTYMSLTIDGEAKSDLELNELRAREFIKEYLHSILP